MSTALLVLDCQRFFESMLPIFNTKNPQKKPALTNIHRLIEHCRAQGYPIILTQHGHLQEAFESTASETPPNTNQLIRKWGTSGLAVRYSKDWEFVPSIDEVVKEMKQQASSGVEGEEVKDGDNPAANIWRKNDDGSTLVVVQKETYDAFLGSSLLKVFEDPEMQKVQRIIVGGVMTDARSCFSRGWETIIASDAAASAGHEQHRRALVGFEFAFGDVLETDEILERLK